MRSLLRPWQQRGGEGMTARNKRKATGSDDDTPLLPRSASEAALAAAAADRGGGAAARAGGAAARADAKRRSFRRLAQFAVAAAALAAAGAAVLAPEVAYACWRRALNKTGLATNPARGGDGAAAAAARSAGDSDAPPVRVAVVGAGIAGLSAAHALHFSTELAGAGGEGAAGAARFNVTVLESLPQVGGHSTTWDWPTKGGGTYPVDAGFAYMPTMRQYEPLRRFQRAHGVHLQGPLQQRVAVYRAGFEGVPKDKAEVLDRQCDRFMRVVRWVKAHKVLSKVLLGPVSLRNLLRALWLDDDFFLLRLYPVIRFVIVSGSKGAMLDATALGGLATFTSEWASCYGGELHGDFDWYNVEGGAQSDLRALEAALQAGDSGTRVLTGARVRSVRDRRPGAPGGEVAIEWEGPDGVARAETFDAVVMATPPDVGARLLGEQAPAWLRLPTSEPCTVVLHSDERVLPPPAASEGAAGGGNMVYVAAQGEGKGADANYANAGLSVRWDDIHGDAVEPTPILTYNPDGVLPGEAALRGEKFRTVFRHMHLPSGITYLRVTNGIANAHAAPHARVFYAGAWVDFSLSHPKGLESGSVVARALGARTDHPCFYLDDVWADADGYEAGLRAAGGRWEPTEEQRARRGDCPQLRSRAPTPAGVSAQRGTGSARRRQQGR